MSKKTYGLLHFPLMIKEKWFTLSHFLFYLQSTNITSFFFFYNPFNIDRYLYVLLVDSGYNSNNSTLFFHFFSFVVDRTGEMEGMGSGAMAGEGDYVYLTVKDAKSAINQRVSLLAAVVHRGHFEPSCQSTGERFLHPLLFFFSYCSNVERLFLFRSLFLLALGTLPVLARPTLVMFDLGFSTLVTSFLSYFGSELVFLVNTMAVLAMMIKRPGIQLLQACACLVVG